jgi:hypothetical protein
MLSGPKKSRATSLLHQLLLTPNYHPMRKALVTAVIIALIVSVVGTGVIVFVETSNAPETSISPTVTTGE